MKIFVCIKGVPDTASSIRIDASKKEIVREGINYIMNPYDEYAVEEPLRIKDKYKETEVALLSAAASDASEILRMGIAMGADSATQIKDPLINGSDPLTIAKILSNVIKRSNFDIIFCGKQAVDDDCAQVGPMLAQLLGIPIVTFAVKFELFPDGKYAIVHRETERQIEVIKLKLPCLVTAEKGLNIPRLPSLSRIMQAKKKEIAQLTLFDIGLTAADAGADAAKVKRVELIPPEEKAKGIILQGDLAEIVSQVVRLLKEKEKIL